MRVIALSALVLPLGFIAQITHQEMLSLRKQSRIRQSLSKARLFEIEQGATNSRWQESTWVTTRSDNQLEFLGAKTRPNCPAFDIRQRNSKINGSVWSDRFRLGSSRWNLR